MIAMKTLKEKVMKLLMDRIGVDENEEFEAQCGLCGHGTFKFCKCGVLFEKIDGEWMRSLLWSDFLTYFEDYKFKKKPFKPADGEEYWRVCVNGEIYSQGFASDNTFDCLNRTIGNCFRTRESAEAHREEILKMLKGENDE